MSNFSTFAMITEGNISTAPNRFVASTPDSLATLLAAGYLNDLKAKIKLNDLIDINYLDTSTYPLDTGEAALNATFRVNYDPSAKNWNLLYVGTIPTGISAYGVHSANYTNNGGSATTAVTDSSINPNSVVLARWASSSSAVTIQTVQPGNGTLTVVSTGDPGSSVLEYISFTPSLNLQNQGVYAYKYSNAGGSATITITNPTITTSMVVNANFASQANAAYIEKVTVTAGTITILCNTDPGVSVVEYVATLPSSALTALGLYGASYSNAGGSATTTITDSTLTANSVVVADWATSANAVRIQKVTPSASTLTILSSGDPGVSVLNYQATPIQEGSATIAYLPLSGGQMTGQLLLDRGTATSTAGAATVNKQAGVITTESLTTAAAAAYAFTLTNSRITTSSIVILQLMGGTNTTRGLELRAIPANGSATLSIYNNNVAGTALNGTLIFGFTVI